MHVGLFVMGSVGTLILTGIAFVSIILGRLSRDSWGVGLIEAIAKILEILL
jgi:hypothetical protein